MALKKWVVAKSEKELAKMLSQECDIDPFAALIASARGYTDPAELEQFLSDEVMISDPKEMIDIEKAAQCVEAAITEGTLIAVFGDYDCDGITATALLYDYLKSRNANCIYYIPDRMTEGYGMNKLAIERLSGQGVGLIITVDNGISCAEEIEYAYSKGMKVVVTDHHIPPEKIPVCEAVVDPHRKDCPSEFKSICGAQVAFRLVCVMENREPEELLIRYGDLLALAIVGDIMPLILENRSIVKYGINIIRRSARLGISAVMNVAAIEKQSVTAGKIAFGIVPRINAAGRMGRADRAVKLLLADKMLEALEIANDIDADNAERQRVERAIFEEAQSIITENSYEHNRVIVVSSAGWHHGVLGIVSARITEFYGKPSIVLSGDGDELSGSGRSYSGFSLYDAINACKDCLLKFGGHELAAGMSLKAQQLSDFRKKINEYAHSIPFVPPVLKLDCRLNPAGLAIELADSVKMLEPFGMGNPTPIFGIYGVTLDSVTPIGAGKHLRLLFKKDTATFQALLFGVNRDSFPYEIGETLDLAVTLDKNLYNEVYSLSVQIKALRPSGADDDAVFASLLQYENYLSGGQYEGDQLLPTREQVGEVYKFIAKAPVNPKRVENVFLNTIGFGKTSIAVKTLLELGLIESKDGRYRAAAVSGKTDLKNSDTYRRLLG